jgi:hypothetical protein
MRKLTLLFIAFCIIYSCDNDDTRDSNTELVGNWELIEVLASPGGIGTFSPVVSDKTITFNNDGTLTSNGQLCSLSIDIGNPSSGTYSIIDSTFNTSSCSSPDYNYSFQQDEKFLIIQIPCIEPCIVKYKKSENE